jgi:hypothetical protein
VPRTPPPAWLHATPAADGGGLRTPAVAAPAAAGCMAAAAASRCWRQLALPAVVECHALHCPRGCTLRLLRLAVVA